MFKDASFEYLEWAREQLGGDEMLVEFRHRSWLDEDNRAETLSFLERIGAAYVTVDAPRSDTAKNLIPTVPAVTSGTAYVRFHGRNLGTWNKRGGSAADRFDYLYSDEELARMDADAAGARRPGQAGLRVLQQQRVVRRSGQPARPHLAGGGERAPAARLLDRSGVPAATGGGRVELRAMHVLSVIHGADARTELFAPAIEEGGHRSTSGASPGARRRRGPSTRTTRYSSSAARCTPTMTTHIPGSRAETSWLKQLLDRRPPVLGVCLGVQLLARAAGAWVGPLAEPRSAGTTSS